VLRIFQAETDDHKAQVRELFWEYLQWANAKLNEEFGVNFDINAIIESDMVELAKFAPPHGRLLLAADDYESVGIAGLRKLNEEIGEIKRMYVRPAWRSKGVGHTLVGELLKAARQMGYLKVRLDSARFMQAAHKLYRSVGFQEIHAYEGSEIPIEFQSHWIFMEKILA
jgi:GNAT superfamily N-acetyltransferase